MSATNQNPVINLDTTEVQAAKTLLKKGLLRRLYLLIAFLFALILWSQCVVITYPSEYKVIQQFGEIKTIIAQPGVSFKLPIIQSQRTLNRALQIYDIPISDVITRDKKTMVADSFVLWRVSDPTRFIRSLEGNTAISEQRIGNVAYNAMKNVISEVPQSEMISGRDKLASSISIGIGDTLEQYGVDLVAIETKHLDLPEDNKQAVFSRMISERNNIAASYQAEGEEEARMIRTQTDKEVSVLLSQANARAAETIAQGEQQYMEILAEAYNDPQKAEFYSFVRALEAAKVALGGNDTTLILAKDSPLAQVFYNVK